MPVSIFVSMKSVFLGFLGFLMAADFVYVGPITSGARATTTPGPETGFGSMGTGTA